MSVRGDLSRNKILAAARTLFAAKGFSAVTMQDICDSTNLSRGGLYRHYASTAEVFTAIINEEQKAALNALDAAKNRKISPDTVLFTFLKSRMNKLANSTSSIDNATAEFAACSEKGKALLIERARVSVEIITQILQLGVAEGYFKCDNCPDTALHIICLLEGVGKHNALIPLKKEDVDVQLEIIRQMLS